MQVTGLDHVIEELTRAGATIEVRAGKTVDDVAHDVNATARDLAPEGTRPHPGPRLADSIETTGRGTVREVGPTARHGWFVEHGTYKDAPQPYMAPALDQHEDDLVHQLEEVAGDI